jgi:ATP-dependent Clp protease ATP-binding subunit ClpA
MERVQADRKPDDLWMPSYQRYSHHARRALSHAGMLVRRFRHPRVDTGHLLVGVLLSEGSIGHTVLRELNLKPDAAERALASLTLPTPNPPESTPNDAALDIALDLAADESAWLGHHYVGTEHLLLGITRTNVGNAADLLRMLAIQPDQVRRRVRRALNDGLTEYSLQLTRRSARLSELSRRVITAAEQLAIARDHRMVGLGHLLRVLAGENRSTTAALLRQAGLDQSALDRALDVVQANDDPLLIESLETVLDQALERAQSLGSHYTGTEHLLLALAGDGHGAALLRAYGVSPDILYARIEEQLRGRIGDMG